MDCKLCDFGGRSSIGFPIIGTGTMGRQIDRFVLCAAAIVAPLLSKGTVAIAQFGITTVLHITKGPR